MQLGFIATAVGAAAAARRPPCCQLVGALRQSFSARAAILFSAHNQYTRGKSNMLDMSREVRAAFNYADGDREVGVADATDGFHAGKEHRGHERHFSLSEDGFQLLKISGVREWWADLTASAAPPTSTSTSITTSTSTKAPSPGPFDMYSPQALALFRLAACQIAPLLDIGSQQMRGSMAPASPSAATVGASNGTSVPSALTPVGHPVDASKAKCHQPLTAQAKSDRALADPSRLVRCVPGQASTGAGPCCEFADGSRWNLTSLIYRTPGQPGSYANTVHRDMDETAVANAPRHTRLFLNVWVPLCHVTSDPLAILLPETVSAGDVAGFRGLEYDRTSLRANDAHRWVYYPDMQVGDALVWRSETVYHAAFHTGPAPFSRESLDMRIWVDMERCHQLRLDERRQPHP
eukprot:TRINITY_DN859_c0_g1_i2.p1 TRINITY_DN859_c0_g1~~TRINITY_DN859_c0_g1_i2.p1  ORF type:complete len:407 (-),score=50.02 TRINITY_DN859_c0_g1_i2:721-1941(-)